MPYKQKVQINKVCPYSLNECLLEENKECPARAVEDYPQRVIGASRCNRLGDKVDNKGWINKYKMVQARTDVEH